MAALELREDEIGRFDLNAYRARRARMWAEPTAQLRAIVPAPVDPAAECYAAKDATFDLGLFGAFHPRVHPSRITCREIIRIVSEVYGVPGNCLRSPRRSASIVRPRQEAMWLAHKFTKRSLPEIGRQFGGRDHTTVLHAVRKINQLIRESAYEPKALPVVENYAARLSQGCAEIVEG